MKNRYKELLSDTLVIGLGNFTTKLIYFFLMPIYTMAMTASEFGEADLLNNLAALLLPVFTLSIAEGVFRFVLDKKERSEEHTSELQSRQYLVCRLLLEKKRIRSLTYR